MAQAKTGDTVKVHYTGKLSDGSVFDSSEGCEPLEIKIGEGQLIAGFEEALSGMEVGESKTVTIPVDKAYGPYQQEMEMVVGKSQFPAGLEPKVGQQLQVGQPGGQTFVVTVTAISGEEVTLDANHPLAGKGLIFDLQLVEIV